MTDGRELLERLDKIKAERQQREQVILRLSKPDPRELPARRVMQGLVILFAIYVAYAVHRRAELPCTSDIQASVMTDNFTDVGFISTFDSQCQGLAPTESDRLLDRAIKAALADDRPRNVAAWLRRVATSVERGDYEE